MAGGVVRLDSGCQQSLAALSERPLTRRRLPRGSPEAGDPRYQANRIESDYPPIGELHAEARSQNV